LVNGVCPATCGRLADISAANARFLLPFLAPYALGKKASITATYTLKPELEIIISGTKPDIRAYVIIGYNGAIPGSKFLFGEDADTAVAALEKLLKATVILVGEYKNKVPGGKRVFIGDCGGYYMETPKTTPEKVSPFVVQVNGVNGGGSGSGMGGGNVGMSEELAARLDRINSFRLPGIGGGGGDYVSAEEFVAGARAGLNIHGMKW